MTIGIGACDMLNCFDLSNAEVDGQPANVVDADDEDGSTVRVLLHRRRADEH